MAPDAARLALGGFTTTASRVFIIAVPDSGPVSMMNELLCYRCGESLAGLSLPLSRRDACPGCGVHLHVCRMCSYFDPTRPRQCTEDDAEEVMDKGKVNFCEWFVPTAGAFDPAGASADSSARNALASLFGDGEAADSEEPDPAQAARDLFD